LVKITVITVKGDSVSKLIIGIEAFGGSAIASSIPTLWGIVGVLLTYCLGKALDLF
jgi:hypothetical protein